MTADSAHILVVEDEELTRSLLTAYLESQGFRVSQAWDAPTTLAALEREPVDVALVDVELPGVNGFQLAAELRTRSSAGIIFVTRRADVGDRVLGLELGGDDYVVKPPDLRELVARIRSLLRRLAERSPPKETGLTFGDWTLYPDRRLLTSAQGVQAQLSPGEVAILATLAEARGEVVSRERLFEVLSAAEVGGRSLDVLIHRLRRKLGEGGSITPRVLLSVYRAGYRIADARS